MFTTLLLKTSLENCFEKFQNFLLFLPQGTKQVVMWCQFNNPKDCGTTWSKSFCENREDSQFSRFELKCFVSSNHVRVLFSTRLRKHIHYRLFWKKLDIKPFFQAFSDRLLQIFNLNAHGFFLQKLLKSFKRQQVLLAIEQNVFDWFCQNCFLREWTIVLSEVEVLRKSFQAAIFADFEQINSSGVVETAFVLSRLLFQKQKSSQIPQNLLFFQLWANAFGLVFCILGL